MAVIVRPLNILGMGGSGGPGKTTGNFSDSFNRANAGSWGPNWAQFAISSGAAVGVVQNNITSTTGIIKQTGSGSPESVFMPSPLLWMASQAAPLNQFCQFQYLANASAAFDLYCCCVASVDAFNSLVGFYAIQVSTALALTVIKGLYPGNLGSALGVTTLSTPGVSIVAGDTIRLEARLVAGSWNLTALKNGSSIATVSDASFAAVLGVPGVSAILTGNGQTLSIGSFQAGTL